MGNAIPTSRRLQVKSREASRCCRCGGPARNGDMHHRRSRSVRDEHRHCACNMVWLCQTCHDWVHAHPERARAEGFIVLRSESEPGTVGVETYFGRALLDCTGSLTEETHAP